MTDDLIGRTLANHYRFDKRLGEGTFAQVYRVHDMRRNVDLAAKVLRPDIAHEPQFIERFRREGAVLARLQHPHIVRYYDLVDWENYTFILIDYVPGETLQRTLYKLGRPLKAREVLEFLKPLTAALHYAHSEGVIHRDLKPANILLHENGNLLVTDFGIARLLDDVGMVTTTGAAVMGTPLYMAPEQIMSGDVNPTTDVYSLGVILYQMLSGSVPFSGKSAQAQGNMASERIIYEHLYIAPAPLHTQIETISESVEEVVLRCLAKEPSRRFVSVRTVYEYLAEAIGQASIDFAVAFESNAMPFDVRLPEISQFVKSPDESPLGLKHAAPAATNGKNDPALHAAPTLISQASATLEGAYSMPTLESKQSLSAPTLINMHQQQLHDEITPPHPVPTLKSLVQQTPASSAPHGRQKAKWMRKPPASMVTVLYLGVGVAVLTFIVFLVYMFSPNENSPRHTAASTPELPPMSDANQNTTNSVSGNLGLETESPTGTNSPAVASTSGNLILYSSRYSSPESGTLDIFVINADGTGRRQLTFDEEFNETGAVWSPDGAKIAYYGYDGPNADIFVMNADGSDMQNLTNTPEDNDRYVSWSPDGTQLVFHSDRPGVRDGSTDFELYILTLADGSINQLTFNNVADLGPDWSPDRERIVFHSYEGNTSYIYTIKTNGTDRQRLSPDNLLNALFPSWSSDGQQIAFHVDEGEFYQIYVMNADGSNTRPLLDEVFDDRFPDWSPDGRSIIFQRQRDGIFGIYKYSFSDATVTPVTTPFGDFLPDWQPVFP